MEIGYELAFPTRTYGPRTWFNFKCDWLYLRKPGYADITPSIFPPTYLTSNLLDGTDLNIGQFMPEALRRVRYLALDVRVSSEEFVNAIELCGNLENLFVVYRDLERERIDMSLPSWTWGRGRAERATATNKWRRFTEDCRADTGVKGPWMWANAHMNCECSCRGYWLLPDDQSRAKNIDWIDNPRSWYRIPVPESDPEFDIIRWKQFFTFQKACEMREITKIVAERKQAESQRTFKIPELKYVIVGREPVLSQLNEHRLDHLKLRRRKNAA
ncbi:hypothetical protein GQ53DRAFT_750831 [Thozetella sp. PMI_491]|nr:hypothetical protein GQ53DRAFT_750831 [Thozetella sp. PMI_491]